MIIKYSSLSATVFQLRMQRPSVRVSAVKLPRVSDDFSYGTRNLAHWSSQNYTYQGVDTILCVVRVETCTTASEHVAEVCLPPAMAVTGNRDGSGA